jgi:hypothetical protein
MPVRITNRSRGLVTVELNAGESLHLAPGETSKPIEDYQTRDNPWIAKLVDRGVAVVEPGDGGERKRSRRGSRA